MPGDHNSIGTLGQQLETAAAQAGIGNVAVRRATIASLLAQIWSDRDVLRLCYKRMTETEESLRKFAPEFAWPVYDPKRYDNATRIT